MDKMNNNEIFERELRVRLADFIYKSNPLATSVAISISVKDNFLVTSREDRYVKVLAKREITTTPDLLTISASCELELKLKDKNCDNYSIEQFIKQHLSIFNTAFGLMSSLISSTTAVATKTPIVTPPVFLVRPN